MKNFRKLLYVASLMALVILMLFTVSKSQAIYMGDNAVPDGAGGWALPDDKGFCVTGIKSDGTMNIDLSVGNSRPDCLAKIWPAYETQTACRNSDSAGANVEGTHYWTSTCIVGTGLSRTAISLSDLDRTRYMCEQNGGTWKTDCTSNWTAMGPTWSAAPVASTSGSTDGFCYTRIRLDNYDITTCPTTTFGYRWGNESGAFYCTYDYGISGLFGGTISRTGTYSSTIKNMKDVTTATAGDAIDLSLKTQGQCQFDGYSFNNHLTKGGITTVPTTTYNIATPITQVRAGCLSCHNNTTQYNTYKGRWKSDYLKQGHKNMLRKVTPGIPWAGADGVVFTEAATPSGATGPQSLDFAAGTATASTWGTKVLMYLFGDWMAPAPDGLDTIVWRDDLTKAQYNGTSTYSCAPCHTTGYSGPAGSGICVVGNVGKPTSGTGAVTTSGACTTAGGTWYPSIGEQTDSAGNYLGTYQPIQPGASWPGKGDGNNYISGITGRWDHDGIVCNRCHNVAYDPSFPINDNGVNAPQGFTTHETDIFDGETIVDTICFSCHQSIPYTNNGLGDAGVNNVDLLNPTNLMVKNTATAPAYIPEFNSHPIGNMFLNSPHARFTGSILPTKVGKYEVVAGGTFNSGFKGMLCRSSTTAGGGNVLETNADGSLIKTEAECNIANGKASDVFPSHWQEENGVGNCTTCHNVHESLFDASAEEPIRRECAITCHTDKEGTSQRHPTGPGTPSNGVATNNPLACETCHMPKATDSGFPMHVWRINADAAYSTFPTAAEFGIGATATKKIANASPDSTGYTPAVWVDLDITCGQCHSPSGTAVHKFTKEQIAQFATVMHDPGETFSTTCSDCHDAGGVAAVTNANHHAFLSCETCHSAPGVAPDLSTPQIVTDFCTGCHSNITTDLINHQTAPLTLDCTNCHQAGGFLPTFATACNPCHGGTAGPAASVPPAPYLTADKLVKAAVGMHKNVAPVASMEATATQVCIGEIVTVTDTSTDLNGNLSSIIVDMGDKTRFTIDPGDTTPDHVYSKKGKKKIKLTAYDSKGLKSKASIVITVLPCI